MSVASFPIPAPATPFVEATFAVQRRQSAGLLGNGDDFVIDRGLPQWKVTAKTRPLFDVEIGAWEAFRDQLRGAARYFTMFNPRRQYPLAFMPAGPPVLNRVSFGTPFDGWCSLNGNSVSTAPGNVGSDLIGIGPPWSMPAGLTLQYGDHIEIREGANLIPDINSGLWGGTNSTITPNSATDAIGTTTAATVTRVASGFEAEGVASSSVVAGQGLFYRCSIWIKGGTYSGSAQLAVRDGLGLTNQFALNITIIAGSWQRFEFTGQMSPGAANGLSFDVFVGSGSAGDTVIVWKPRVTLISAETVSLHRVLDTSTVSDVNGNLIAWIEPELPLSFDHDAMANIYQARGKFRLIDLQLPVNATGRNRPGQVTLTAMSTLN